MTTDRRSVADATAELLGGKVHTGASNSDFEILTDTAEVDIVVDTPSDISTEMKLWDRTGLAHHCDGQVLLSDDGRRGATCGCPPSFAQRRARARSGHGPQAYTATRFRLAGVPGLGTFLHESLSWDLAENAEHLRAAVSETHGPAHVKLRLAHMELAIAGLRVVSYRQPQLDFVAPVTTLLSRGLATCTRTVTEAARTAVTVVQAVLGRLLYARPVTV